MKRIVWLLIFVVGVIQAVYFIPRIPLHEIDFFNYFSCPINIFVGALGVILEDS